MSQLRAFANKSIKLFFYFKKVGLLQFYRLLYRTIRKKPCPICSEEAIFEYYNGKYVILKCVKCSHAFVGKINDISKSEIAKMYSSFDYWQRNCFHQKIFNIGNQEEFKDFLGIRVRKLNELKVFPDREVNGKKASMIEVGCSEGSLLKYFYDRGCKVTGLDINAEIIKKASELYVFPFIAGNFLEHNFGENSYDLVISFHVLEHLTDVARAVEKFYQILNSGGKVVVEVPFGPEEYDNLEHFHFFSIESARCLFEKCFKNIEIRESDYLTASNIKCGAYYLVAEKSDK